MLSLPPALFLVMLELTVGSFLSLYFLDIRGDTSRGFVVFQGVLYLIFAVLTLLAMSAFASGEVIQGRGLDGSWLAAQGPMVLAFALLMVPWNVLLWMDRQPRVKGKSKSVERLPPTRLRLARFAAGGLTSLTAIAALFTVGMAYRTLADSRLGGAFVVAAFLAGGVALGGVMTAMLLGHWYLNTPAASGKPLEFATLLTTGALALELVFMLLIGPSTANPSQRNRIQLSPGTQITTNGSGVVVTTPTVGVGQQPQQTTGEVREAPLTNGALLGLLYIMGFGAPLVLGAVAWYLTRGRSFQSATGMLYLCVAFIFMGEILGRGILLMPAF